MNEFRKISNHLFVLNNMFFKLEAIGVKINDEDKTLRFIWFLPSSYEHMKPIMMCEKKIVVFSKVTSKLFFEERKVSDGKSNVSFKDSALAVNNRKKNSKKKNIIC